MQNPIQLTLLKSIKQVVEQIKVGRMPGSLARDRRTQYLFVSNVQDNTVTVIDLKRLVVLKNIDVGIEPNGILCIDHI